VNDIGISAVRRRGARSQIVRQH